jgi:D-alanyl-D-alanine carboxypeptidase (penicillin-binding protein 5/6)
VRVSRSAALLAALAIATGAAAAPEDRFPKAASAYLVAIDGEVAWARHADEPRPPASLTKIMTALLVLEKGWDEDARVPVSARAAAETGSRLGLRAGESMRAGDALTAMLLRSANDACVALAEHAAGTEAAFVRAMNARAKEMGLSGTRFENACGHDGAGHRSTASDLRRLAEAALAHPEFRSRVALRSATVRTTGGRVFQVDNGNLLIGSCRGASGVKTGFTAKAGKCLVALAERDGVRVLLVLLDAPDRWWTAAALLEEAFDAARPKG